MNQHAAHRQLLDAAKLLLQRFERNAEVYRGGPALDDWPFILRTLKAIDQSREALARLIGEPQREEHCELR